MKLLASTVLLLEILLISGGCDKGQSSGVACIANLRQIEGALST